MAQAPYMTNDVDALRRLAAAADVRVQGQLTAAIAADQRALVFAGFLAAAAAAIGSASVTALADEKAEPFLGQVGFATAAGLLVAMVLAVIAARPTRWFFPGSLPFDWREDFETAKDELEQLRELLVDYDNRITRNNRTMKINGRLLMAAAIISVAALWVAGALVAGRLL